MKYEILFINSNNVLSDEKFIAPPLGIAYLIASIKNSDINGFYNVSFFDANLDTNYDLLKRIHNLSHKSIVAFSAMTPSYNYAKSISDLIKVIRPDILIVIGGYHSSLYAKEIIYSSNCFDAIILGNGEQAIVELCKQHMNNIYQNSKNLVFRWYRETADYNIYKTAWPNYLIPDREEIQIQRYINLKSKFSGLIQFSRGCIYNCCFCSVNCVEGMWQSGSIDILISEMEELHYKYGLSKNIVLADNLFLGNKKIIHSFLNKLSEKNLKIKWSCDVRLDYIDYQIAKKMYDLGCVAVFVGIESGSLETLKKIGNKPNQRSVSNTINMLNSIGIRVNASFIIGFPWEDESDVLETIRFSKKLNLYSKEFSFATPFKRTKLFEQMNEYNCKIVEMNYNYWNGRTPIMLLKKINRRRLVEMYLDTFNIENYD